MDDDYYAEFLSSLSKISDDTLVDDNAESNDPEFNYISKAKRVLLCEDFQSDKVTKKRKKEKTELQEELINLCEVDDLPYQVAATASVMIDSCKMQPGGQDLSSSHSPVKATTGISLYVSNTSSSFTYTRVSQPEPSPSSAAFSKCETQHPPPPPPQLAHTESVSNADTAAVVAPEPHPLIEDDAGKIAFRTRSKLPLTSTSITEIESAFVAPDITADMYDNYDDAEYAMFLSFLNKAADDAMIEDDADANDPEFNLSPKVLVSQLYEDSHLDKPTKNRKKEKTELWEELINLSEVDDLPYTVAATASGMIDSCKMQPGGQDMSSSYSPATTGVSLPVSTTSSSFTYTRVSQREPSPSSAPFSKCETQHPLPQPPPPHLAHGKTSSDEPIELSQPSTFTNPSTNSVLDTAAVITSLQRALIEDNMRKHIQLLLQSYMLFQNSSSFVQETTQAKSMIEELNYLRQRSCAGQASTFNVCNLDPAIELLSKPAVVRSDLAGPVWNLTETQKLAILNSPAFIYPHLLPVLTQPKSNRKYNIFSRGEDNLIAFGLEKFQKCKDVSPTEMIHQLLIRGKTLKQIFYRVQFMSSGKVGDNPIKEVKKTGKLPAHFPKPTIDHFYTVAPKDQMSDLLPAWVRNTLSACKVKSGSYTNMSQPAFTGHLSQQQVSGMSVLSTRTPYEKVNHVWLTTPCQIQTLVSIPVGSLPVTFQTPQALQLSAGLPPIACTYMQFSAPTAAGSQTSPAVTFPSFLPSTPSAVLEQASRGSHNMKKTKRTITAPSSTSRLKKQKVQAPVVDEVAASDSYTQGHQNNTSPDLLAKTMLSCGIGESPTCPSPHTQFQDNQCIDQLGMSFTSSTPIAQDKHPSVRNLNWQFHNIPATQIQNIEETYKAQLTSSCSQASACQIEVSQNETTASTDIRSCVISPLHCNQPDVIGEPQTEEARIKRDSEENLIPYTNSSSVTNHDLLGDISKHTAASTGSDFNDSSSETSQGIFFSDLPLNSAKLENKKQSPTVVDNNSQKHELFKDNQKHELFKDNQKLKDLLPQNYLLTNITLQSQTENTVVADSGLALDYTNQTDKGTCETVQADKSTQSGINLSVQNGKVSLNSVTEACEIAQDDRSPESGIKMSVKDNKEEFTNVTETNSTNAADVILSMLTDDSSSSIDNILTHALQNMSDSSNSDTSNIREQQTKLKFNTIRQILKDSEKNLPQTTTRTSVLVPESNCVASDIVNQNSDTIIRATDSTNINKPAHSEILINDDSASTSSAQKTSTMHKELNKHVHRTVPKSVIVETESLSPTKAAAQVLKKKTTLLCQNRSPVKLLPKQPQTALSGSPRSKPLLTAARMLTQKTRGKNTGKKSCKETTLPVVKDPQPSKDKATLEPAVIETENVVLSQEEDKKSFENDDQPQLDDLKAASTTIRYVPKKGSRGVDTDSKSKAQKKKDVCLSMLEPDIIDRDSKTDESHTAYAQHYFTNLKQKLSDDIERFKKFLAVLHDVNKNHLNPVELYADMAILLSGHQDLVDDFAGFLLSFQAVECNCFVSDLEFQQLLIFLKRLEICCDNSLNFTYQQSLKIMSRWLEMLNQKAQADTTPFKDKIAAVLRHVPNIMDDLKFYFFGTPFPDSHPDDFEDVNHVDKAMADVDEFEETTLLEGREGYKEKLCSCQCHQDEKLCHRIKHCYSCSLKDTICVNSQKQEKADLESTCPKPIDDLYKTATGELTEIVTDVSGSSSAAIFGIGAQTPVTMENLPETRDVTRQHDQPDFDYAAFDDGKSYSTKETEDDLQNISPLFNLSQMLLDDEPSNLFVLSEWTEEQDRSILNVVIANGVTQEAVRKLHSKMPAKSVEEINSRARLLLQMLEQMGDTESDTDASDSDSSEQT